MMAPAAQPALHGEEQHTNNTESCVRVTGSKSVQKNKAALGGEHGHDVLGVAGVAPALGANVAP